MALSILENLLFMALLSLSNCSLVTFISLTPIVDHLYYQLIEFRAIDLPSEGGGWNNLSISRAGDVEGGGKGVEGSGASRYQHPCRASARECGD
jgi:hypothetical protein